MCTTDITTQIQKRKTKKTREFVQLFILRGIYICVYVGMCSRENRDRVHVQCTTIDVLRIYCEQKNTKKRLLTALALATHWVRTQREERKKNEETKRI